MNASMSSDKVSLVNFYESTPNSCLGFLGSLSAKDAAIVLINSSDLQTLSSSIHLHSSSFCLQSCSFLRLSSSRRVSTFCRSCSHLQDSSSHSSINLLNSDVTAISPLTFPECRSMQEPGRRGSTGQLSV